VLKLYRPGFGGHRAEAAALRSLDGAGIAPRLLDVVDRDGRTGLVLERFDGPDMLSLLQRRPWRGVGPSRLLGAAHPPPPPPRPPRRPPPPPPGRGPARPRRAPAALSAGLRGAGPRPFTCRRPPVSRRLPPGQRTARRRPYRGHRLDRRGAGRCRSRPCAHAP